MRAGYRAVAVVAVAGQGGEGLRLQVSLLAVHLGSITSQHVTRANYLSLPGFSFCICTVGMSRIKWAHRPLPGLL